VDRARGRQAERLVRSEGQQLPSGWRRPKRQQGRQGLGLRIGEIVIGTGLNVQTWREPTGEVNPGSSRGILLQARSRKAETAEGFLSSAPQGFEAPSNWWAEPEA